MSVSLPYISVFSAGQSTGQGAGQSTGQGAGQSTGQSAGLSTGYGADPDAGQSTDPDTGRGTGDIALRLRRVLPSAWEPEVQKVREVQERPRDPGPRNPRGIITLSFKISNLNQSMINDESCTVAIKQRMSDNMLKLNDDKN